MFPKYVISGKSQLIPAWLFTAFAVICCFAFNKPARGGKIPSHSGKASYYHEDFKGHKTSSGERYDESDFTAAHRNYPLNTILLVTNRLNHRTAVVRINERGPYRKDRIIDLSKAAAVKLNMISTGVAPVKVTILNSLDRIDSKLSDTDSAEYRDCTGEVSELSGISVKTWSASDRKHAFYVATDLALEIPKEKIVIGNGSDSGKREFTLYITGIMDSVHASLLVDRLKAEGFTKAEFNR